MNKANETLAFYRGTQLNDKSLFIDNLGWLLSQTREKIDKCEYIIKGDDEFVKVTFDNGYEKLININMDSYLAIVEDVAWMKWRRENNELHPV